MSMKKSEHAGYEFLEKSQINIIMQLLGMNIGIQQNICAESPNISPNYIQFSGGDLSGKCNLQTCLQAFRQ